MTSKQTNVPLLQRQEARHVAAQPVQPFTLPSVNEQDDDDLDTQRFGQQVAQQNRIDRQRD